MANRALGLCLVVGCLCVIGSVRPANAGAPSEAQTLKRIMQEVDELKADKEQDEAKIQDLEQKVEEIQGQNQQLKKANQKLQTDTSTKIATSADQARCTDNAVAVWQRFDRYLGSHTFTVTGAAGGNFIYDQQSSAFNGLHHASQNSFFVDWEPMILYRPTDWILFQGVLSAGFGSTGTGTDLSTADFQIFANKYLTVVAGLFDQPFGDWYENQSPMWVNRFVTAPLPFGVEPVVPPAEIGVQFRGGMQFGKLGQDFDYTVWGGNGPNYSSSVLGAAVSSPTAVANSQTNGKSIGARFRLYPLPVDLGMAASSSARPLTMASGQTESGSPHGAWISTISSITCRLAVNGWKPTARCPTGRPADNRQGWYLQAGYFLNGLNLPFLPEMLNGYLHRFEPLVRYSGVNQRGVSTDDIAGATGVGLGGMQVGLVPDFGLNGSPVIVRTALPRSGVGTRLLVRTIDCLAERIRHRIAARRRSIRLIDRRRNTRGRNSQRPRLSDPIHCRILSRVTVVRRLFAAIILATLAIGSAAALSFRRRRMSVRPSRDACSGRVRSCGRYTATPVITRGRAPRRRPMSGTRS